MVQMAKLLDKYILYAQAREKIECSKDYIMENIKMNFQREKPQFLRLKIQQWQIR